MSGKQDPPVLGDTSSIYHAAASSKGTEINCNSLVQQKTKTVQNQLSFSFQLRKWSDYFMCHGHGAFPTWLNIEIRSST